MEQSFGRFLRQNRQEKKLTQKELAKLLFVSESTVSKWENDAARPDIALLPRLSQIFGVSEHELITASIDNEARQQKLQAKKWRALSMTWSLFFYIAYAIALIPCFICDLAINKRLSWFWIVLSALLLAFTFTNLPKLIKKHKLIFVPLSMYLALLLLLGVCCIYSKGNWFFIPAFSVLLGLVIIFAPIYITKYHLFEKIRKKLKRSRRLPCDRRDLLCYEIGAEAVERSSSPNTSPISLQVRGDPSTVAKRRPSAVSMSPSSRVKLLSTLTLVVFPVLSSWKFWVTL